MYNKSLLRVEKISFLSKIMHIINVLNFSPILPGPHVLVATISIACIMLFIYNLSVKGPLSGVSSNSRSLPRDFSFEKYKPGKMASSVNIPASEMHHKWIVITSINYPTEDVKKLANIPGWRMVMVGDTKSPKDWRYLLTFLYFLFLHGSSGLLNSGVLGSEQSSKSGFNHPR